MHFEILTKIDGSKISQEVSSDCGLVDKRELLFKQVIDTQENETNKALRALGWIPPEIAKRLIDFVEHVQQQCPEKPDYWSSCSQCGANSLEAEDLVDMLRNNK